MSKLNRTLEKAIESMNEAFYLLPIEERDKVESIIFRIRNLER